MGRKTAKEKPPAWSLSDSDHTEDDCFRMIWQSMILSEAYKKLSNAEKAFLIVLNVNAASPENRSRLTAFKKTENRLLGIAEDADILLWTDRNKGFFIFSQKEQELYGYSRSTTSKLMRSLVKAGFVDLIRHNKHGQPDEEGYRKVNVYQFSSRWKRQELKDLD